MYVQDRLARQLVEQVGAGLDAAMEVGEGELLVGSVQVIVVLAPAQEQCIDAQVLLDAARRPESSLPRG